MCVIGYSCLYPWFVLTDVSYYSTIDLFVKDDANPGKERYVKHAEILQHGPAAMTGPNLFTLVRDRATGMENNPDSYSFLSSLAVKHHMEGLCTRALYKRALSENDPVRHLLCMSDL